MTDSLSDWLERIEQIHPVGWDLGLERVGRVCHDMSLSHPANQVVLVAGTNGKGSTCELLSQMAMASGLRVGKSTSPHLYQFNERITVNGVAAKDAEIIAAFERIDRARGDTTLTYFEYATLASLLIFQHHEVDLAILEVGLGGRLDAMNIVDPDVTVITSISLDHQSWLGDTRELIAREKAGIMRHGVPCIVVDRAPPASLIKHADAVGARLELIDRDFSLASFLIDTDESIETRLPRDSFIAACQAAKHLGLSLDTPTLRQIAANTELPGRKTWVSGPCPVLLDVAHNPAAALDFADYVKSQKVKGDIHAIFGIYKDKDIDGVLAPMSPMIKTWHLVDLEENRGERAAILADRLADRHAGDIYTYAKMTAAAQALETRVGPDDLIVVMGSFPVVAGVLKYYNDKPVIRV